MTQTTKAGHGDNGARKPVGDSGTQYVCAEYNDSIYGIDAGPGRRWTPVWKAYGSSQTALLVQLLERRFGDAGCDMQFFVVPASSMDEADRILTEHTLEERLLLLYEDERPEPDWPLYAITAFAWEVLMIPRDPVHEAAPDKGQRPGTASAGKNRTPAEPEREKLTAGERAIPILLRHPDWTNSRIAEEVGCSPSALTRSDVFQKARAALAAPRAELKSGFKGSSSGELDAWANS